MSDTVTVTTTGGYTVNVYETLDTININGTTDKVIIVPASTDNLTVTVPNAQLVNPAALLEAYIEGTVNADEVLIRHNTLRQETLFIANSSICSAEASATANTLFNITKNNTVVGNVVFLQGQSIGVLGFSNNIFLYGDVFRLVSPHVPDITLSNITFSFYLKPTIS